MSSGVPDLSRVSPTGLRHAQDLSRTGYHPILFADFIIFRQELLDQSRHLDIPLRVLMRLTGDDQRRTSFIDQDVIHLIDDGVIMPALDLGVLAANQLSRK